MKLSLRLLTIALLCAGPAALAQQDAPPPRAGRISVIQGDMTIKAADEQDWTAAGVNYPVGPGMSLATAPGTRAEVQFGGTVMRLDGRTTLSVQTLDDTMTAVSLEDGSVDVRVRILFDNERIEIDAGHGHVTLTQAGAYRIDAGIGSHPTHVAVFKGRAELATSRGRELIQTGAAVEANQEGLVQRLAADSTFIDDWSEAREHSPPSSTSQQYVGDDMPGSDDLDTAGAWQQSPDYGAVWYPDSVPADWEPYAYGTWAWIAPWGWTWVDAQPWGFAPFHYGRWVRIGGRWAWSPGARNQRPTYAPALVGFVGSNPWRFNSRDVRPDHWVPLAPGEIYQAPYTRNVTYLQIVNRGNAPGDAVSKFDWRQRPHGDFTNGNQFRGGSVSFPANPRPDRRSPAAGNGRSLGRGDRPRLNQNQSQQNQSNLDVLRPPIQGSAVPNVVTHPPNPVTPPPNPVSNPDTTSRLSQRTPEQRRLPPPRPPSAGNTTQGSPGQGNGSQGGAPDTSGRGR